MAITPRFSVTLGNNSPEPTALSGVYTTIPFNTIEYDTNNLFIISESAVVPVAGVWHFEWQLWMDSHVVNGDNGQVVAKLVHGTTQDVKARIGNSNPSFPGTGVAGGGCIAECNGIDKYWLIGFINGDTANPTINTNPSHTYFQGVYLGPLT